MSSTETKFAIGRDFSKKQKEKERKYKNKNKRKEKKEYRPLSKDSKILFLRSWLLKPLSTYPPKILQTLSNPHISFSDRYERLSEFNKITSELVDIIEKVSKSRIPTKEEYVAAYEENQKLRWAFKKLVLAWRLKHVEMVNEEDIITLEEPKKPVYLIDFSAKKKYQFEAKSFLIDCVNRLFLHSDFFPEAQMPRNLLTNKELSWNDLWSVALQFKKHGTTHWAWEGFAKCQFDIHQFVHDFDTPLKYEMVDRCFKDPSQRDVNWYVAELITNHTEGLTTKALKWAVYRFPRNPFILRWKELCYTFWKVAVIRGEEAAENNALFVFELTKVKRDTKSICELIKLYHRENIISN